MSDTEKYIISGAGPGDDTYNGAMQPSADDAKVLQQENEALRSQIASRSDQVDARAARIVLPLTVLAGGVVAVAGGLTMFPKAAEVSSATVQAVPEARDVVAESVRSRFVDKRAEEATMNYFPGAFSSEAVNHRVTRVLTKRGFTPQNTLFATSTCPDEVNVREGELVSLLKDRWGENFALGGLGGVPFTGKAGFNAYAHHVADNGKLFILFAPHVGIEFNGKVGALRRVDQNGLSTSCGAAVGAFKALKKGAAPESLGAAGDTQINYIKQQLASRLDNLDMAPEQISYVTYQMYVMIRDFFVDDILPGADYWDDVSEIAVLGGIMINRAKGGDRFMPLMFQTREEEAGSTKDIFEEAFGPLPNLETALGSGDEAASVRKKSLNWDKPRR